MEGVPLAPAVDVWMNEWINLMENPQDKKGHKTTYTCEVFDKKSRIKVKFGKNTAEVFAGNSSVTVCVRYIKSCGGDDQYRWCEWPALRWYVELFQAGPERARQLFRTTRARLLWVDALHYVGLHSPGGRRHAQESAWARPEEAGQDACTARRERSSCPLI